MKKGGLTLKNLTYSMTKTIKLYKFELHAHFGLTFVSDENNEMLNLRNNLQ